MIENGINLKYFLDSILQVNTYLSCFVVISAYF